MRPNRRNRRVAKLAGGCIIGQVTVVSLERLVGEASSEIQDV